MYFNEFMISTIVIYWNGTMQSILDTFLCEGMKNLWSIYDDEVVSEVASWDKKGTVTYVWRDILKI